MNRPSAQSGTSARICGIVAKIMGVAAHEVTETSSPDTIESWDSLQHMKLILAVEEAFGVQFSDRDIVSIKDVQSLIALLGRKPGT